MSLLRDLSIRAADSASIDAFNRWRVSQVETIFDSKFIFTTEVLFWDDQFVSGGGTSSSRDADKSAMVMSVSSSTAGVRVRQTFRRFHFQPGKSQVASMTAVFWANDVKGVGLRRAVGLFDDENGFFFEDGSGAMVIGLRSSTTGSVVTEKFAQVDWNLDVMDGTGPSGFDVDWSKIQTLIIDFQWGAGRIRMGLDLGGEIHYVHQFLVANEKTTAATTTPNLPFRWEIENTGGFTSPATLEQYSASIMAEGGPSPLGAPFTASTLATPIIGASIGTIYAILGFRLKPARVAATTDFALLSMLATSMNDTFEWSVHWKPTVSGTFTYVSVAGSNMQRALGNGTQIISGGTQIGSGYGASAAAVGAGLSNELKLGAAIDGTVDEAVLGFMPLSNNTSVVAAVTWTELS